MTKDLTKQWKNGGLKRYKKYYIKDKLGRSYIKSYNKKGFKGLVEEVLCEVPSYDHFVELTEKVTENAKLKELLKECYNTICRFLVDGEEPNNGELIKKLTKIDEVLK